MMTPTICPVERPPPDGTLELSAAVSVSLLVVILGAALAGVLMLVDVVVLEAESSCKICVSVLCQRTCIISSHT